MQTNTISHKIANALQISTANFTAATTDIITSNAHGLSNGDRVVLTTTDTLPAGLATATVYTVFAVTTNTFKLSTQPFPTDQAVDITDTGTGTHTFTEHDVIVPVLVEGFRNIELNLHLEGTPTFTIKIQGSNQELAPDFSAAQSSTNSYDGVAIVDLEDQADIDGDTGISVSGSADHRHVEVNTNKLRWLSIIMSGWTGGTLTAYMTVGDNK